MWNFFCLIALILIFVFLWGGLFERKREKEHEAGWVGSQGASGRRWGGYVIKILKL